MGPADLSSEGVGGGDLGSGCGCGSGLTASVRRPATRAPWGRPDRGSCRQATPTPPSPPRTRWRCPALRQGGACRQPTRRADSASTSSAHPRSRWR